MVLSLSLSLSAVAVAAKWSASPGSKVGRVAPRAPQASPPAARYARASRSRAPCSSLSLSHGRIPPHLCATRVSVCGSARVRVAGGERGGQPPAGTTLYAPKHGVLSYKRGNRHINANPHICYMVATCTDEPNWVAWGTRLLGTTGKRGRPAHHSAPFSARSIQAPGAAGGSAVGYSEMRLRSSADRPPPGAGMGMAGAAARCSCSRRRRRRR